jgi:hypothetical protein
MTQAMVIDEVLPKRRSVFDQVVAQRMAAEDRPDAFMGHGRHLYASISGGLAPTTSSSERRSNSYLPNRKRTTQGALGCDTR